VDEDRSLFLWLRHYALVIVLVTGLGVIGGWAYTKAAPPKEEAWTIVLQTGQAIGPLQLGSVAQAVFSSAATYAPVLARFRPGESPQRFLANDVQLLPIPQSNAMIVIGRDRSFDGAAQLSSAMATSLVSAFASRNISHFTSFAPQPATGSTHPSTATIVLVAAAAGLWLGLAIGVVHYRARRPVLALERAMSVAEPDRVVILAPRRWWALRRRPEWRDDDRSRSSLQNLADGRDGVAPELLAPGWSERTRRRLSTRVGAVLQPNGERLRQSTAWTVFVCTAATGEFDLALARQLVERGRDEFDLIWVR
jgi:hypothetical protein